MLMQVIMWLSSVHRIKPPVLCVLTLWFRDKVVRAIDTFPLKTRVPFPRGTSLSSFSHLDGNHFSEWDHFISSWENEQRAKGRSVHCPHTKAKIAFWSLKLQSANWETPVDMQRFTCSKEQRESLLYCGILRWIQPRKGFLVGSNLFSTPDCPHRNKDTVTAVTCVNPATG